MAIPGLYRFAQVIYPSLCYNSLAFHFKLQIQQLEHLICMSITVHFLTPVFSPLSGDDQKASCEHVSVAKDIGSSYIGSFKVNFQSIVCLLHINMHIFLNHYKFIFILYDLVKRSYTSQTELFFMYYMSEFLHIHRPTNPILFVHLVHNSCTCTFTINR